MRSLSPMSLVFLGIFVLVGLTAYLLVRRHAGAKVEQEAAAAEAAPVEPAPVVADPYADRDVGAGIDGGGRQAFLEALATHSPALMYVKDADGRYVVTNDAMRRALGAPATEPGTPARSLVVDGGSDAGTTHTAWMDHADGRRLYEGTEFDLDGADGAARVTGGVFWDVTAHTAALKAMTTSRDAAAAQLVAPPPVAPSTPVQAAPPAVPRARVTQGDRQLRVLLAEDNPVNRRVAELTLVKLGHRVDTVSNGQEAVNAVLAHSYDVVVMDLQMPLIDGLEATRRIRAGLPTTAQPYIMAMTATAGPEDRQACIDAGMDDCLAKPVRAHAFRAALAELPVATEPSSSGGPARPLARPATTTIDPADESPPAVDEKVLDALVAQLDSGQTGLRDVLLGSYLDEGSAQIARLLMAVTEGDTDNVASLAHTLRSTSALLGATDLATMLLGVETAARTDPAAMAGLARKIEHEHTRVATALLRLRRTDSVPARS